MAWRGAIATSHCSKAICRAASAQATGKELGGLLMDNRFYKSMRNTRRRAARAHFALTPVAFVAAALLPPGAAWAQQEAAPALKPTPMLREELPRNARTDQPTFVSGEHVQGRPDL